VLIVGRLDLPTRDGFRLRFAFVRGVVFERSVGQGDTTV